MSYYGKIMFGDRRIPYISCYAHMISINLLVYGFIDKETVYKFYFLDELIMHISFLFCLVIYNLKSLYP